MLTQAAILFFTSSFAILEIDFLLGYVDMIIVGFIVTDELSITKINWFLSASMTEFLIYGGVYFHDLWHYIVI